MDRVAATWRSSEFPQSVPGVASRKIGWKMTRKSLVELYRDHTGKVSDKWRLYLDIYDHLFGPVRENEVRLLEIGVQNGGSLEIWSTYFRNGRRFIGCDIDSGCASLRFDDARVSIVVGDINSSQAAQDIFARETELDVIIDDGSHKSGDIIRAFATYFPHLSDGGFYVVEDLHCSYWPVFEGGLFSRYSAMAFFRALTDVVNAPFFRDACPEEKLVGEIARRYNVEFNAEILSSVYSVSFLNSLCIIRKKGAQFNRLGDRIVAGAEAAIKKFQPIDLYDKQWAGIVGPSPGEQIDGLSAAQLQLTDSVADLERRLSELKASRSWRVTKPLRLLGRSVRSVSRAGAELRVLWAYRFELAGIVRRAVGVFRREGFGGFEKRLAAIKRGEFATAAGQSTKPSTEFLRALAFVGDSVVRLKRWWLSTPARRRISKRLMGVLQGRVQSAWILPPSLRIHVDRPNVFFQVVKDRAPIQGWAVDLGSSSAVAVRFRIGKSIHTPDKIERPDVQNLFSDVCRLPARVGFAAMPVLRTGFTVVRIEVQDRHGRWAPVHKSMFLRVPFAPLASDITYPEFAALAEMRLDRERPDITRHIELMPQRPHFTILIVAQADGAGIDATVASITTQIYPHYRVILPGAAPSFPDGDLAPEGEHPAVVFPGRLAGDFLVIVEGGQRLSGNALYEFAAAIAQYPDVDVVYGDEDDVSPSGTRCNPFYKPDWSPDYLETFNYLGFAACFRIAGIPADERFSDRYDLVLRYTERSTRVRHIAKILGHNAATVTAAVPRQRAAAGTIAALSARLTRTGRSGIVTEHPDYSGCFDVQLTLRRRPLVSIVIPTAGKTIEMDGRPIDLIRSVVAQIRDVSSYDNIEIVVVHNGDLSVEQRAALDRAGCRGVQYRDPVLNVARKINLGAAAAAGELLLLLNDDVEIIDASWIERMVEHFEKPHVGVVGGRLLYPDGRLQHVGVVHNFGNPDHVRRYYPRSDAGYFFSSCGVRNYLAVTGACMMTPASLFGDVGGYSEELAVSYNDVDYCHKVRERGRSIVYAPGVQLTHMESQSRTPSLDWDEAAWFQDRWSSSVVLDPFYNERFLTVSPATFTPKINRRML